MGNILDRPIALEEEDHDQEENQNQEEDQEEEQEEGLRYVQVNSSLSFDFLPEICKLKIFSHLNPIQKAIASRVCVEWHELLQSPILWTDVDLTLHPQMEPHIKHLLERESVEEYSDRLLSLLDYLSSLDPPVHRLCFTFDIYYHHSGFLDALLKFLTTPRTRCSELIRAKLIWSSMTDVESDDSSDSDLLPSQQSSERLRNRQRLFVKFFQCFVDIAPNIRYLELPFDWSSVSVQSLLKLNELVSLNLRHYFLYQSVEPAVLSRLLTGLGQLRELRLDIWTASGNGLLGYKICSKSLEEVDVSVCRGFNISDLDLPSLRTIRVKCRPWSGPLSSSPATTTEFIRGLTCLHDLLAAGAPKLEKINDHRLRPNWRDRLYPQLDAIMNSACPCHAHYQGDGCWMQADVKYRQAPVTYQRVSKMRPISARRAERDEETSTGAISNSL